MDGALLPRLQDSLDAAASRACNVSAGAAGADKWIHGREDTREARFAIEVAKLLWQLELDPDGMWVGRPSGSAAELESERLLAWERASRSSGARMVSITAVEKSEAPAASLHNVERGIINGVSRKDRLKRRDSLLYKLRKGIDLVFGRNYPEVSELESVTNTLTKDTFLLFARDLHTRRTLSRVSPSAIPWRKIIS